jgi:pyruvate formate lyase activating enzyme
MTFNVLRYTLDDGPGIRSTVFLKGCPLTCLWCANPESQKYAPEVVHRDVSCIKCRTCVTVCPEKAVAVSEETGVTIDRAKCNDCGLCVDPCPTNTMQMMGREMTVDEVFATVEKDKLYYNNSGGGVTVSGGEPLGQPDFVLALFARCHEAGLNTCLDTSGFAPTENLLKVLPETDILYFDIKLMDDEKHKQYVGTGNRLIQHNLEVAAGSGAEIVIRVPVLPDINDSDAEMESIAVRAKSLGTPVSYVHLLPFHRFGKGKYTILDRAFAMEAATPPSAEHMEHLKTIFEKHCLVCEIKN